MITIHAQKNAVTGGVYFEKELDRGDYYKEHAGPSGIWFGRLARELELDGPVTRKDFDDLARGLHPASGEKLTQRQRTGRVAYHDFVCSAPKSVSIVGLVAGDTRVIEAHRSACEVAFKFLERSACVRLRKGDKVLTTERAPTGNILAAAFDHEASRDLDCQLHRHLCVFNVTRTKDGALMALDARRMYDRSQVGTEVYRNELCRRLLALGYSVANRPRGFEIAGVPEHVIRRFSSRSRALAQLVSAREQKLGRRLSKKERSLLVHTSRRAKKLVSEGDLRKQLRERLKPEELQQLLSLVPESHTPRGRITGSSPAPAKRRKEPALGLFESLLVARRGRNSSKALEKFSIDHAPSLHEARRRREPNRGRDRLSDVLGLRCPGRNVRLVRSALSALAREMEKNLDMEARIFR